MKGTLILVIGPSGSGKGALISHIRKILPQIIFPVSCTTRVMRPGEVEGQTYFFVSDEEFEKRIAAGEFLEWKQLDHHRSGILKAQVLGPINDGKVVLREVDVKGAREILGGLLPRDQIRTIYIDGGSWRALKSRILARAALDEVELESRHRRFEEEVGFKHEADFVIHNEQGRLEKAEEDMEAIVGAIIR